MYRVNVDDAIIGQIIAEPIISADGILICNPGTPVSNTLIRVLPKFGVNEITVESIVSDTVDVTCLNFNTVNNLVYLGIKNLDIESIVKCANGLVNSMTRGDSKDYALLNVLYDYDLGTYNHSINVASLAITCGIKIGLNIKELRYLALGSLLHDIGKTRIPTEILNKNGKLSTDEFEVIKLHPQYGYDIIIESGCKIPEPVKNIILQHHENHDGTGYPNGMKDFHIDKLARIVHIADCYEALCSRRPYKAPVPRTTVREIMEKDAETKFDPILLKKFLSAVPMYLVGEEVEVNDIKGVVVSLDNYDDPMISIGKNVMRMSSLRDIRSLRNDAFFTTNFVPRTEG